MVELSNRVKKERAVAFYLFIFFLSIYLLTASGINIHLADVSKARIMVAQSIVERLDLALPSGSAIRGADGRDYSWFSIGSVLLAIPFYIAGKLMGISPGSAISIMNQLVGAATGVLIFFFTVSLGYSRRASFYIAVFYGLGTMAWYYSKDPGDHALETFFVLLSVYYMYRFISSGHITGLFLSGVSLGFALITRPTSILVIAPLLVMIFYYSKRSDLKLTVRLMSKDVALFSAGFLPFVALNLWYNYYRFGSIFETGYQLIAARSGLDYSATPLLTGLRGFLISPGKGFFYYSPVALLFFFSIKPFVKKHPVPSRCFIMIMIFYLLFFSKYIIWHGDWAWGPRYLLVVTPFLIIPIAELLDSGRMKRSFFKVLVSTILAVSLIIQFAAISVCYFNYFNYLQDEEKITFTVADGDGIQTIMEPPPETYFDWHKAPILAQFMFVHDVATKMKNYRYSKPPEDATRTEKIRAQPWMNVLDFFWIYLYFLNGSYSGFVAAFVLFLLTIYSFCRLRKML